MLCIECIVCKWIYFTHRHRVISSHALSSLWVWRFIVCKFIPLTATQFVILTCEMILKQVVSAACVHFTGCLSLWSHSLKIMLSFSLKIRKALTMRVISQQFVGSCFTTGVFGSSKAILCLVVALHSRLNANVSPGCQVLCWPPWCGLCLSRSDTWRILETWVSWVTADVWALCWKCLSQGYTNTVRGQNCRYPSYSYFATAPNLRKHVSASC